jgi:hypothetical protein
LWETRETSVGKPQEEALDSGNSSSRNKQKFNRNSEARNEELSGSSQECSTFLIKDYKVKIELQISSSLSHS